MKTKYPILLVHGMGFRDSSRINYWGRIPHVLEQEGCLIFYGGQDSNGTTETNGSVIAEKIKEIVNTTGCKKVNIIAHSKGGLDARYAISTLEMGKYVASLSTVSTPHHGSRTVDKLLKLPVFLVKTAAFFSDLWLRICGDTQPDAYRVWQSFTTSFAQKFNNENPDCPDVYYQSYAFIFKTRRSDMLMWFPHLIISLIEGENDGLLTPDSVMWTNFRGIQTGITNRGISHCDEVDLRRRRFTRKSGSGISDITDFYRNMVNELAQMGY